MLLSPTSFAAPANARAEHSKEAKRRRDNQASCPLEFRINPLHLKTFLARLNQLHRAPLPPTTFLAHIGMVATHKDIGSWHGYWMIFWSGTAVNLGLSDWMMCQERSSYAELFAGHVSFVKGTPCQHTRSFQKPFLPKRRIENYK